MTDTVYNLTITRGLTVKSINILGNTTITNNKETVQYIAECLPADADIKNVQWSISNPDIASIDENGVLTPITNGEVEVIATAKDGSEVQGRKTVIITGQKAFLTSLTATTGTMAKTFDPYTYEYNIYVPLDTNTISIRPTFSGGLLRNNEDNMIWANNLNKSFALSDETTQIKCNLTQPNLDSVTYTINVIRASDGVVGDSITLYKGRKELQGIPQTEGQYNVKSTYVNNSANTNNAYYIITVKSKNRLIDIKIIPKTFAPYEAYEFDYTLTLPASEDSPDLEIKAMLWEDINKGTPYAQPFSICR